ncbi:MAG: hypothetical protein A2571_00980 [Candidatus Vogelbacteria bacterium RIFOXYD1_FULL_44_32]|uniref:Uncharacterized protein n=1 Tax=Candidatus Vogelbacteria bacterium RIFOXYD1_FULL_44_32 TaxID=1802438 RepID=A0A1G2QET8_9BACT|nr:MAG: hypothetical protein A2571_00980 [Candidatus Vogelbacteria bacterium RIFOXYD1_FULL_44_32]
MAKDLQKYAVYAKEGRLDIFKGETWATSEAQAINNVVNRLAGEVPKDRRPPMFGQVIEGAGTKRPKPRKGGQTRKSAKALPRPGLQLGLPGVK